MVARPNTLKASLQSLGEVEVYHDKGVDAGYSIRNLVNNQINIFYEDDLWLGLVLQGDSNIISGYIYKPEIGCK